MLKVVPERPADRLRMIQQGWGHLGHTQSEFLKGAGININPEPLRVTGKALPRPQLAYGKGQNGARVVNDKHVSHKWSGVASIYEYGDSRTVHGT